MDFIEEWFGISPDGGNGTLEALWVAAVLLAVAVVAIVVRRRLRARKGRRDAG
jgi:hypothetical protein